jgi:hypothetical protein
MRVVAGAALLLLGCTPYAEVVASEPPAEPTAAPGIDVVPDAGPALPSTTHEVRVEPDAFVRMWSSGCGPGVCQGPGFEVTLFGDGRIEWIGLVNVDRVGPASAHVDPGEVAELFAMIEAVDFSRIPRTRADNPGCGSDSVHNAVVAQRGDTTWSGYDDRSRQRGNEDHESGASCFAPELVPLRAVEARIVEIVRTQPWILSDGCRALDGVDGPADWGRTRLSYFHEDEPRRRAEQRRDRSTELRAIAKRMHADPGLHARVWTFDTDSDVAKKRLDDAVRGLRALHVDAARITTWIAPRRAYSIWIGPSVVVDEVPPACL